MKILTILIMVVVTVSCGSSSYSYSPSLRVKEFISLAAKQDYTGMKRMMAQGEEAEATLRGDSDLLLYAGTEGVKTHGIGKRR